MVSSLVYRPPSGEVERGRTGSGIARFLTALGRRSRPLITKLLRSNLGAQLKSEIKKRGKKALKEAAIDLGALALSKMNVHPLEKKEEEEEKEEEKKEEVRQGGRGRRKKCQRGRKRTTKRKRERKRRGGGEEKGHSEEDDSLTQSLRNPDTFDIEAFIPLKKNNDSKINVLKNKKKQTKKKNKTRIKKTKKKKKLTIFD